MIGVVDYGMGNLRSVEKALQATGANVQMVRSADQFKGLSGVVLPGVGAFGDCISNLNSSGLKSPLCDWIFQDKPFFGICLGYQALFESSEEAPGIAGLGAFRGSVIKFPESVGKVPQMGWNAIDIALSHPVLNGIDSGEHVYFVHSYYPNPADSGVVALTTEYGVRFSSAIARGNLFACQFHPEKSQDVGLKMLRNFVDLAERR